MKLISFVGTTNYRPATYVHEGQEYSSRFFPVVAARIYQPDEVLLVTTAEAYDKHFESIADELAPISFVTSVRIPDGKQEKELWQIFDMLTDTLKHGDQVIFDITLSFRSIPIQAVIAASFWRVAKDVTVHRLIYGALEATDEQGRSAIFDLTPMLNLMAWTAATDSFLRTGNAIQLRELLREAHSVPYRVPKSARSNEVPKHLQNVGDGIANVSRTMRLIRPYALADEAGKLDRLLTLARQEVAQWAKPFATLLDRTREEYRRFALNSPHDDMPNYLRMQLDLVKWYLDKQQVVQSVLLAREWIVSLVIYRLGWHNIEDREYAERLLNEGVSALADGLPMPPPIRRLEKIKELVQTWDRLRDLRNDLAHCGMRARPRSINAILNSVQEIPAQLAAFADDLY